MIVVQGSNFGFGSAIKCSEKIGKYSLGSHIHQFSEIVFVKEGSITITVDGKAEIAKKNDIAVISPFQVHSFETEDFCDIRLCLFSNDILPEFIIPDKIYACGQHAVFTPTYELLVYVKNKIPDTGEEIVRMNEISPHIFLSLKSALFAIYEEYTRCVPTEKIDSRGKILPRALAWMKEHFTENVTMADAARDLGYTVGYISHSLESIDNMNFRGLLNSFRIEHACSLLAKSDAKIIDVALECGFSCERSFHRAFLAIVGMTPGEYRKQGPNILYLTSPNYKKTMNKTN